MKKNLDYYSKNCLSNSQIKMDTYTLEFSIDGFNVKTLDCEYWLMMTVYLLEKIFYLVLKKCNLFIFSYL